MTRFRFFGSFLFLIALCISVQSSTAMEIPLEEEEGVYTLPVMINGVITKDFILDTGASEVSIPSNLFIDLLKAGTIKYEDILPSESYELADGSTVINPRFNIRILKVGGCVIENVPGSIDKPNSPLLLGQSFLNRLPSWTLDNHAQKLIIGETFKEFPNYVQPVAENTLGADKNRETGTPALATFGKCGKRI